MRSMQADDGPERARTNRQTIPSRKNVPLRLRNLNDQPVGVILIGRQGEVLQTTVATGH